MRVEKNDAWMRQHTRIFRALARSRHVARVCIDVLRVSIDASDTLPMRASLACDAHDANAMRLRCATWPTTCVTFRKSRAAHRMREPRNANACREGSIGRLHVDGDAMCHPTIGHASIAMCIDARRRR